MAIEVSFFSQPSYFLKPLAFCSSKYAKLNYPVYEILIELRDTLHYLLYMVDFLSRVIYLFAISPPNCLHYYQVL